MDWLPVLTAFDKQLEVCMPRILHVNNPDLHEVDLSAKELVCSILQFFCLLMKSARDKRYFLLFDVSIATFSVLFSLVLM